MVKYIMVIVQNSIYFLGDYILTGMLEPPLTKILNNYQLPVHLGNFFEGQHSKDNFVLDFRMTEPVNIYDGFMEL